MKFKRIISLSCTLALLGFSAYAGTINSDTIVVTATRTEAKALTTPSKVNVITSKKLKEEGITFVKDSLKFIPGITVYSNGAFGGSTSVNIMGLPTYYTKTLIDGIDVSDPSQPQPYFDYANLMSDDIQRIEIVQGAQSGLYGSNAIGGVINVITKKGKGKPYFKLSQELGSFHTYQENIESGGQYKKLSFYINISRFDTGGISKMDKYNPTKHSYSKGDEKDSYHKTAFSTRLEYDFDPTLKIGTILKWNKTRNYLDNGWRKVSLFSFVPDDSVPSNNTPQAKSLRSEDSFFLSKVYINKKFLNNLTLKANCFYTQTLRYNKSAPGWYDYKGKRWGSNITATYKINKTTITAGLSQQMEKYEDNSPFKKLRYNYAGFLELNQKIHNLTLQGVAREDKYKTFGNHFTYKLGASFLITQTNTILKANYATGFRAPSIWELYAPPIPTWWFMGGNKNLKPEKAKIWNFGFIQNIWRERLTFNALYFKNIIRNRIEYYTDPKTWQSTYKNVNGKTVSHGVELGLKAKPFDFLETGLNYTYTKSKNPDTGKQTARIPLRVYTGYITVKALNNKLTATVDGRFIGKRYDYSYNKQTKTYYYYEQTGKYAVFDFTALYKPTKRLELSLTVKNIFNRFYEEVYGYSTLPRSAFATISYTF
ncbi:TonB-dependent receptor plug domain-containing protein [Hippea alviniae]|uniref:TonB-dependent receptor plug domain-containing protein n=1 Tax=Hippea alviniae TaxID=1279027 RepID=UPI0003B5F353|nr:TonB-dependent receptor [Hippea alviniae]